MTVNISKQLLGMACIVAGAFIPLILCTLNWLPYGFNPADAAEFIHLTTPLLLTVMAITVLVNVTGVVGIPRPGKNQPGATAPERRHSADRRCGNAAPLHLPDRGHQFPQQDFIHGCSLRLRHDRYRSADGSLLPAVIRHHVPTRRCEGIPDGIETAQLPPGPAPWDAGAAGPG